MERDNWMVATYVLALAVGLLMASYSLGEAMGQRDLCRVSCDDAGFESGFVTSKVDGPVCTCTRDVPLGGSTWRK